jgi:tetratricopeptide (TPR) repeat protein
MTHRNTIKALACALSLLALAGCEINKYNSAEDHYENKRYAAAIQELDDYIQKGKNGAIITRSEILRAKCYYELGLLALQRESYDLAIRFLKLSNSGEADQALGNLYKQLAEKALAENNQYTAMYYVEAILREIPGSELTPEMLARRITFLLDTFIDHNRAWETYMMLYDTYPNNAQELSARKQIMRVVPAKIEYARRLVETGYYSEGLRILFELGKYPVVEREENNRMIAEAYIGQAESYLKGENYLEADRFFRIAIQYDPAKKEEINERLEQVVRLFIRKGDEYLAKRDFDNALLHYQKTYDIIPDYDLANQAIARLNAVKADIERATSLYSQAEKAELAGKFGEALNLYRQANSLDARAEYRNKASQMQNMMDAQANPVAFAQRIINDYKGGLLNTRIRRQKQDLLESFDPNEIRDTGWKIMISSSQYKYEARYDLVTPTISYFYVWQVNLKDREIIPLNKISENLMR